MKYTKQQQISVNAGMTLCIECKTGWNGDKSCGCNGAVKLPKTATSGCFCGEKISDFKGGIITKDFNQELFDFFVDEHGLELLSGQINDIKMAVYEGIISDLMSFSDDELDNIFHGIIAEMNKRKAEHQGVDVGFWNSEGEYKEDIQKVDETDEWESKNE